MSQDAALDLHQRLIDGDPVAPSELAVVYLDYLARFLIGTSPRVDESLCGEAAEDAIISLIKNPGQYRPERASLDSYLRMSARGDLKNRLASEARHASRRARWEAVELSPEVRNEICDEEADPAMILEMQETIRERVQQSQVPAAVRDGLTSQESRVLDLMRINERKTEAYADALGIGDLPASEQRREVKRVKDRLTKRLERASDRHE
jgi:RNA polymerase sigma-70 factor, ECF subfamily